MSHDANRTYEKYFGGGAKIAQRPDCIIFDDNVTEGPLRDGGHGFHPLKQRTTMKYIDIEFSDSVVVVYTPTKEMALRLPLNGWAKALAYEMRQRGYGYAPIRNVSVGEHAAHTYYTASVTQRNIEEGTA